jgi:hypothetical protein
MLYVFQFEFSKANIYTPSIIAALASLILLIILGFAQEEIKKPRITPDNPIYFFKILLERFQIWITFDPEARAKLRLYLAENRLAEMKTVIEKGKLEVIERLSTEYEKEMNESNKDIDKAVSLGRNVSGLVEHVAKVTKKHISVLESLLDKVPQVAIPHIKLAIDVSSRGYLKAIENIRVNAPELAEKLDTEFTRERIDKFIKRAKTINCTTDFDCVTRIVCPMAIGFDTPLCDEERKVCYCGPGTTLKEKFPEGNCYCKAPCFSLIPPEIMDCKIFTEQPPVEYRYHCPLFLCEKLKRWR